MNRNRWLVLATLCLTMAFPALGANVNVVCGTPNALQSAIDNLKTISLTGPHTINLSGTCRESVGVNGFQDLTIQGPAIIEDPNSTPQPNALTVIGSKIALRDLILRGSGPDVGRIALVVVDSMAQIERCTVENGRGGINIQGISNVHVVSSTIRNNRPTGISVEAPASVTIGMVDGDEIPTVIQGSTFGISVGGGNARIFGATTIKGNTFGIYGQGGDVFLCCNNTLQRKIVENQGGIFMRGGTLRMNGSILIADNAWEGIILRGATALTSWVNGQIIRNNGASGDSLTGGILVQGSSHLYLSGAQVTGNKHAGIVVQSNSSVVLFGTSVTGNAGEGMHIDSLSTAELTSGNVLVQNGAIDLFCAPNSYGFGDKQSVGRMICPTFDHLPNPRSGPPEH